MSGTQGGRRRRRIIFNSDAYELRREEANTPEGFLNRRLTPLLGTQVDTVALSVLVADAPIYDSRVQPIFGDAHGRSMPGAPHLRGNVRALTATGRCPLRIAVDFAHDHDIELLASVRMNDVHDSFVPDWLTEWKISHPELMVETVGMLPQMELGASAQDFTHEDVRLRKLQVIEEVCERYDVDGIELDYIRHPVLFSRTMRGLPVSEEEVAIITSMMRDIREVTGAAGQRRGFRLSIAARVPDSFDLCRRVGLDLQAWLDQDLVDILIAGGGYVPFTLPVAEFVERAQGYGVPVYPCINQGAAADVSKGAFKETVRGLAANWYRAGAAGVYTWNLGNAFEDTTGEEYVAGGPDAYACLSEIGDPKALDGASKVFCVDIAGISSQYHYAFVSPAPPLPVVSKRGFIKTGVVHRIPLTVGDDVDEACSNDTLAEAVLTVDLRGPVEEDALVFRLNGDPLADGELATLDADGQEYQVSYCVGAPPLRTGRNLVEWSLTAEPAAPIELRGMRLRVTYR